MDDFDKDRQIHQLKSALANQDAKVCKLYRERDEAREALAALIAATVRARNADDSEMREGLCLDSDERFIEIQAEVEDAHVALINAEIEARRVLGSKEEA